LTCGYWLPLADGNIDTTTSGSKRHLFAALSQFERDLIEERTMAGMKAAADRGCVGGRQKVVTPESSAKPVG
jgi:DNA invertase Pin-like site-specific DNA recombinase